jgi:hypothetical protein
MHWSSDGKTFLTICSRISVAYYRITTVLLAGREPNIALMMTNARPGLLHIMSTYGRPRRGVMRTQHCMYSVSSTRIPLNNVIRLNSMDVVKSRVAVFVWHSCNLILTRPICIVSPKSYFDLRRKTRFRMTRVLVLVLVLLLPGIFL